MIQATVALTLLSASSGLASPTPGIRGGPSAPHVASDSTGAVRVADTRLKSSDMASGYYVEMTYPTTDTLCGDLPAIVDGKMKTTLSSFSPF